ncbi:uncharacterized protein A4U43_C10F5790 [Asparagus officinalis]|uniref:Uncharacterized protein n=1 Tax=Asparagus officinalis TaxID=4686 RepID=A0A5P1E100_ASPOF|nr:uncharacterized protein A4U43_C10F5790 [Asparagus officinalis]
MHMRISLAGSLTTLALHRRSQMNHSHLSTKQAVTIPNLQPHPLLRVQLMEILVLSATHIPPDCNPLLAHTDYPPIAGTFFDQLLNFHRLHDFFTDVSIEYKTFRLLLPFGFSKYMCTVDPSMLSRTSVANYGKVTIL